MFGNGGIDALLGGKGENTFVIKEGQKGKTIIPDFSSTYSPTDTIAFIGYNQYDKNRIKYDIFSEFGIEFKGDGMQSCRAVRAREGYNFNLGSEQILQINGNIDDDNLPITLNFPGDSEYVRLVCPSNFIFLNSLEEMNQTILQEYDIFA